MRRPYDPGTARTEAGAGLFPAKPARVLPFRKTDAGGCGPQSDVKGVMLMDAKIFGLRGRTEATGEGRVTLTISNPAPDAEALVLDLTEAEAEMLTRMEPLPALHAAE